jgi:hypothetical protein
VNVASKSLDDWSVEICISLCPLSSESDEFWEITPIPSSGDRSPVVYISSPLVDFPPCIGSSKPSIANRRFMATLGRYGRYAIRSMCSRCGSMTLFNPSKGPRPNVPNRRVFHSATVNKGLLSLLTGDTFQNRLHKEIGQMLEDYDQTLLGCYRSATESVSDTPKT